VRRVATLAIVLLMAATAALGKEYPSSYGFTMDVPDNWLVITKQAIQEDPAVYEAASLKDFVPKVQSGASEFLFNRTTSDATLWDNINVRLGGQGKIPTTPDAVKAECAAYSAALAKAVGRTLAVATCESRNAGASQAFYVEYEGRLAGTVTMQYQLVRPDNKLVFVTATCKRISLDKFRPDFEAIVRSIKFS